MKFTNSVITLIAIGCSLLTLPSNGRSETLAITVTNQFDEPVADSVISAYGQPDQNNQSAMGANKNTVIDQVDKEFIAHVTTIQVGTTVEFPNHDQIRHHVYSFSEAKTFELPLYKGSSAKPIVFDKLGVVTLGCNIHDWMSAYIYVVDTAYFSMTDNQGQASLNLPPGQYEIRYWHPDIDAESGYISQMISSGANATQDIAVQLDIKQTWSFRRGPLSTFSRGRYR